MPNQSVSVEYWCDTCDEDFIVEYSLEADNEYDGRHYHYEHFPLNITDCVCGLVVTCPFCNTRYDVVSTYEPIIDLDSDEDEDEVHTALILIDCYNE